MGKDAYRRFLDSMVMDFEKWHDGIGYDLAAIDEMSVTERASLVARLAAKADDWRDLEALDKLGTEAAVRAIVRARSSDDPALRLAAQRYGPEPSLSVREGAVLAGLADGSGAAMTQALSQAASHPTPRIRASLFRAAKGADRPLGFHAAATLAYLCGAIDLPYDDSLRPLFLRFSANPGPERDAAFVELCRVCGVEPAEALGERVE